MSNHTKIAFLSDLHVVAPKGRGHATSDIKKTLQDVQELDISALILNGDLTNSAKPSQYDTLKDVVTSHLHTDVEVLLNSGNHDLRNSKDKQSISNFTKWRNSIMKVEHKEIYYEQAVGDVYFFMLNSERALKTEAFLSDKQLSWLATRLAVIAKEYKVIMLCCHQPMDCGLYLSKKLSLGSQEQKLHNILSRYHNIVYVSGHTHSSIKDCAIIKTEFGIALDIPAFHLCKNNYFKRGYGIVMDISKENIVIQYRNFVKQRWHEKVVYINPNTLSFATHEADNFHLLPFPKLTFTNE